MNISILLPTRQRPKEVKRMIESAIQTSDKPQEIEFILYIDEDDNTYDGFLVPQAHIKMVVGPRITLSKMWNKCFEYATANILMHAGDDIIFRTQGWDTMVISEFDKVPDKIVFVHGRDGAEGVAHPEGFGTHGFLHRNWVTVTGYFVPPYFSSDYNDTWLNEVANIIERHVYLPDFYTEHMHWTMGKAQQDKNTQERITRHQQDKVDELYKSLAHKRLEDAKKLLEVME